QTDRQKEIKREQALALLNHPFVHERSRRLAEKVAGQHSDLQMQVEDIWKNILQRPPSPEENTLSWQHMEGQRALFSKRGQASDGIGPEILALASLAHTLMNSNEFLHFD
ncbi:MAG: DUF1553 domain-containing protein, partial [Verrucomicrobiota bacterium]